MKKVFHCTIVILIAVLAGCTDDRAPLAPQPEGLVPRGGPDPEIAGAEFVLQAGWLLAAGERLPAGAPAKSVGALTDFARTEVAPGIAHYVARVQIGTDPHDAIRLHRVVRETRPGEPIRTHSAVFLQHGDAKDFTGMFLPGTLSATTPDDFGAAVYWACRDIDVWGIDQAWNLVPAETAEFGFMADWGIDKQYQDLGTAIAMARVARRLTGNGFGKMVLLGYSSGSGTGYALLNAETQLAPGLRQVGAWISADYSPITDSEEWIENSNRAYISYYEGMIAGGEYGYFVGFDFLGNLARDDPEGDSPVFPGFTNLQAAMYLGSGTIFNVGVMHYLAGQWQDGLPVYPLHVTVDQWLDFMIAGAPWEPVQFMLDYCVWSCPEYDAPWDDHFAEITVPVYNLAAAGGIGPITHWCLGRLGSTDVTDVTVQLRPDSEALYDYGHIDLWIADNAPELVWQPLAEWIVAHSMTGNRSGQPRND